MENLLRVGVITSAHGVRGEVKVFSTTDDNSRFKTLKHVLMDTGKEKIPLEIEHVKFFKNMVIKGPNASGTSVFLYTPASIVCTLDEDE